MGFGIIEPKGGTDGAPVYVPGTSALYDSAPHRADAKHDETDKSLLLVPQPSDDPNDPLVCSTYIH